MNMQRGGITAGGTWIVDYTKRISMMPDAGACTTILSETINNGGAPFNLLVDLCRMESPFPLRAVGCVGQDVDGESILKECISHGIQTNRLTLRGGSFTSFTDLMIDTRSGVATAFNRPGANSLLDIVDFDLDADPSRILFVGSLCFLSKLDAPDDAHGTQLVRLLRDARKRGMQTCVDIVRSDVDRENFIQGSLAALQESDFILLNSDVAEILTGIPMKFPAGIDADAVKKGLDVLGELTGALYTVIRFPSGAMARDRDGTITAEGSVLLPKALIKSASGAGHAFTAGFLHAMHEEWPIAQALKLSNAVAAACLLHTTSSGGVRKVASCLSLMETYGQRKLPY
jgi:sugar/nucleoside kinase (ribokinase family)